jgi:thiosulfate/3-mercaptopyruvate sulfurtransferase
MRLVTSLLCLLVSFDELQKMVQAPQAAQTLRLLDARPRSEYDKGHIPGAVWVDLKAAQALGARAGGLNDRAAWQRWLEPLGIAQGMTVLIYDANRQLDAARLWWMRSYLGVERVGLIDGNFPLWAKQGRPISTETPAIKPVPFNVRFQSGRLATKADVLQAMAQEGPARARLVDARSQAEHTGETKVSKRGGHIPTACRLEWNTLVDADGRFLDSAALEQKLTALGIKPNTPVITHCQSGGRASVNAFVFERLGQPTRNYYLGWSEWGNDDKTPVRTGQEPATSQ